VVEEPVGAALAHLHAVDVGSAEVDAEPDPGIDDGLVEAAGLGELPFFAGHGGRASNGAGCVGIAEERRCPGACVRAPDAMPLSPD
jgi:hypothetical protein